MKRLDLERNIKLLTLITLVISIGGFLGQLVIYLKGSDLVMEPPAQILFFTEEEKDYVRFTTKLVYINKGSPGYGDIVKSEIAKLKIGENEYPFRWEKFIQTELSESNEIELHIISDADPFQVDSGSVISHETKFSAWSEKPIEFLKFQEFNALLEQYKWIVVVFESTAVNAGALKNSCKIDVKKYSNDFEEKKWMSVPCN